MIGLPGIDKTTLILSTGVGLAMTSGPRRALNERHPGATVFIGDRITEEAARVFDGIHTYNPRVRKVQHCEILDLASDGRPGRRKGH